MKVLVTDNAHLYKTPDGKYYTPSIYNYEFFQRYLEVFEEVRFASKTKYVENIDETKNILVTCEGLEIYELPWYQGLMEMIKVLPKLIKKYRQINEGCQCSIYRVAQIESYFAFLFAKKRRKPFAVEVVNDPSSFVEMNTIFKMINSHMLKFIVSKANGASYVTKDYLQGLFPNRARIFGESDNYFESYYSSIQLSKEDVKVPKEFKQNLDSFEIVHVSNSINSNSKGHKTLIDAVKIVKESGYNIYACVIGDGNLVLEFKNYAESIGVADRINFIGRLHNREELLDRIAKSMLFVFPTYTEGLPRCIIEAQAVGLPCISTPVAGIPELIESKYLFSPDDSDSFAKEIIRLIHNPEEMEEMSKKNISVARRYTKEILSRRREKFYRKLKKLACKVSS